MTTPDATPSLIDSEIPAPSVVAVPAALPIDVAKATPTPLAEPEP
ncbi:MAG: hypothetical protein RID96_17645 [Nitratireductor sp.]